MMRNFFTSKINHFPSKTKSAVNKQTTFFWEVDQEEDEQHTCLFREFVFVVVSVFDVISSDIQFLRQRCLFNREVF